MSMYGGNCIESVETGISEYVWGCLADIAPVEAWMFDNNKKLWQSCSSNEDY